MRQKYKIYLKQVAHILTLVKRVLDQFTYFVIMMKWNHLIVTVIPAIKIFVQVISMKSVLENVMDLYRIHLVMLPTQLPIIRYVMKENFTYVSNNF
ncbi:unnamed protein product [Onchocerca flexuosa]|uniref:Uncharacterized protein n=1 Tax=Onchocerca flexuosa TaxID=387005 RepID=A0A183HMD4_9BILA|nr:unnamed protein product [Onchocerca flexuosa]